MKNKRPYFSPTVKVVEMEHCQLLLENSVRRQGYVYSSDGWED